MAKLVREPIYQQLNTHLRDQLRTGEFPVGSQFLTERQVAVQFSVSRITANKALASLVAEGLLDFRKGVGTFVREPRLDYDLRALVSFTDKAKAAGKVPSTVVLKAERIAYADLDPNIRLALDLPSTGTAFTIHRLRLADGEPLILEHRCVVERHCPDLLSHDLSSSLYQLWQNHYHLDVAGADQTIRAMNVDAATAKALAIPSRSAALEVTCVGRLSGGAALWWEQTYYRGDRYSFQGSMGSSMPAIAGIIA